MTPNLPRLLSRVPFPRSDLRVRWLLAIILVLLGLDPAASREVKVGGPGLVVTGPAETVISGPHCDGRAFADSPARMIRVGDREIYLMAAHSDNIPFMGIDSVSLQPNCRIISKGSEDSDPTKFDDKFWIQALMKGQDGAIWGLASHEYDGARHSGKCTSPERGGCWYSSILLARTMSEHLPFSLQPMASRRVAVPQEPYDGHGPKRSGFFTASNVVEFQGAHYFFSYAENTAGISSGNCLFRSQSDTYDQWFAYLDGQFHSDLSKQAANTCTEIAPDQISSPIRSIIWVEHLRRWAAFFFEGTRDEEGVYYSLSSDLVTWSDKELLLRATGFRRSAKCGAFYAYPSAIAADNGTASFDHANSSFFLYLTRFNFENCVNDSKNRDLIRIQVKIKSK